MKQVEFIRIVVGFHLFEIQTKPCNVRLFANIEIKL